MFRLVVLATHFADKTRGNGESFLAPLLAGSGSGQREMVLGPGNADVTQPAFFVDGRASFVDCISRRASSTYLDALHKQENAFAILHVLLH